MTKREKRDFVVELTEQFKASPNFYIVDISGFSVEKAGKLRGKCFQKNLKIQMIKNSLIEKSLNQIEGHDFEPIKNSLHYTSTVIFAGEDFNAPAKLIKEFRADGDLPALKAAYIEGMSFIGDKELDALIKLKSKNELLGDVIGLLQSPIKNVVGALTGQSSKLASLVLAIGEKKQ